MTTSSTASASSARVPVPPSNPTLAYLGSATSAKSAYPYGLRRLSPRLVPIPVVAAVVPKHHGSYNCGWCGLPKKGHVCFVPGVGGKAGEAIPPPPQQQEQNKLRRVLQFDDPMAEGEGEAAAAVVVVLDVVPVAMVVAAVPLPPPPATAGRKRLRVEAAADVEGEGEEATNSDSGWVELGTGWHAPGEVVLEVLRRMAPRGVAAAAARVSCGWRECARRVWQGAEEVRLRTASVRPIGALMARCPSLARLVLRMDR